MPVRTRATDLRSPLRSTVLSGLAAGSLAVAAMAGGCSKETPAPAVVEAPKAPAAPPAAPAPAAPASASGQSAPDCVGPFTTEGAAEKVKLGARTATRTGAVLSFDAAAGDGQDAFGLIANLKEATGDNLFNLKRYVDFFVQEKVDAILVAGDSGEAKEGIVAALEPLAKSGLPVFVIPGNREARADFRGALEQLAKTHPNVVDMTQVRLVNFDGTSIASLPGYYYRRYVHVGDAGCIYFKEDVENLKPVVAAAKNPVVLLAHAEPYGKGPNALDFFGDGNAGDSNLKAFLADAKVPFGVFANIHEAGGRATDLASNPVAEGTPAAQLFVNPGLADSTAWKLNDGQWSNGMVATLTVKDGQASYKTMKLPALTDAEREQARKLEPSTAAIP